jgi:TonB family protein
VDRKAAIILRRECQPTPEARRSHINGIIQIDTVFTASGKVANVRLVRGLSHGLSEAAVAAAREILFIPALKEGKRVSVAVRVEYAFENF